jgi:DNA-binding MarR family transcriptional regulator
VLPVDSPSQWREVVSHSIIAVMDARLPLPTLLSQALVAFTIEFDNESERQMAHRTTNYGSTSGSLHAPCLVSLVMWSNCMQFVDEKGISVRELERLARTTTNLAGMRRWGYIVVEPDPADNRPKPPRSEWLIRATPAGRKAQEVWRRLFDEIEKRWMARFGNDEIDQLRKSLWAVASQFDVELPDCLPIPGYGLISRGPGHARQPPARRGGDSASSLPLSALLSKVLLRFAIDFERESEVSLAIRAISCGLSARKECAFGTFRGWPQCRRKRLQCRGVSLGNADTSSSNQNRPAAA